MLVVDSFYDDDTFLLIRKYAKGFGCEYIEIENKGYGFGNNCGLDCVNTHYTYKYACVCNPDTYLTSRLSLEQLNIDAACIAPDIIARNGKHQNPYWCYENESFGVNYNAVL